MTLLYQSETFRQHDTGFGHPERADRITAIAEHLQAQSLAEHCRSVDWQPIDPQTLQLVHPERHIYQVETFAQQGGGQLEADTVVSPQSYSVAQLAAGAACDAVGRVLQAEDHQALCLIRPPGHHALADHAMGFCLFNNIAVAAKYAIDQQELSKVLIVDWDVHHGNGTQDIFYEDEQVAFLSMHRYPFYPGSGAADETGSGPGLGKTLNLPIPFGTTREEILSRFAQNLEQLAEQHRPELVLLSAGFDAHRLDPIGSLGLESEDFQQLTQLVLDVAKTHCGGRVVCLLEGGYHLNALAESVGIHLQTLLENE